MVTTWGIMCVCVCGSGSSNEVRVQMRLFYDFTSIRGRKHFARRRRAEEEPGGFTSGVQRSPRSPSSSSFSSLHGVSVAVIAAVSALFIVQIITADRVIVSQRLLPSSTSLRSPSSLPLVLFTATFLPFVSFPPAPQTTELNYRHVSVRRYSNT